MAFSLTSGVIDDNVIGTSTLARRWCVTPQTIHNYCGRGLPIHRTTPAGQKFFHWRDAEKWRAENVPDLVPGQGRAAFRRLGAGRKPRDDGAGTALLAEETERRRDEEAKSGSGSGGGGASGGAEQVQDLLREIDGPDDILRLVREGRMTRATSQALQEAWKAIEIQVRLAKERGGLIDARDAEQAWKTRLAALRGELDNLPGTAAQHLLAAGLITADREPEARAALEAEIDRILANLARGNKDQDRRPEAQSPAPGVTQDPT